MFQTVGVREFRAGLSSYINAGDAVALTRHGQTVGWFIPTPPAPRGRAESLKQAGAVLDRLLAENDTDTGEILKEYQEARRKGLAD